VGIFGFLMRRHLPIHEGMTLEQRRQSQEQAERLLGTGGGRQLEQLQNQLIPEHAIKVEVKEGDLETPVAIIKDRPVLVITTRDGEERVLLPKRRSNLDWILPGEEPPSNSKVVLKKHVSLANAG